MFFSINQRKCSLNFFLVLLLSHQCSLCFGSEWYLNSTDYITKCVCLCKYEVECSKIFNMSPNLGLNEIGVEGQTEPKETMAYKAVFAAFFSEWDLKIEGFKNCRDSEIEKLKSEVENQNKKIVSNMRNLNDALDIENQIVGKKIDIKMDQISSNETKTQELVIEMRVEQTKLEKMINENLEISNSTLENLFQMQLHIKALGEQFSIITHATENLLKEQLHLQDLIVSSLHHDREAILGLMDLVDYESKLLTEKMFTLLKRLEESAFRQRKKRISASLALNDEFKEYVFFQTKSRFEKILIMCKDFDSDPYLLLNQINEIEMLFFDKSKITHTIGEINLLADLALKCQLAENEGSNEDIDKFTTHLNFIIQNISEKIMINVNKSLELGERNDSVVTTGTTPEENNRTITLIISEFQKKIPAHCCYGFQHYDSPTMRKSRIIECKQRYFDFDYYLRAEQSWASFQYVFESDSLSTYKFWTSKGNNVITSNIPMYIYQSNETKTLYLWESHWNKMMPTTTMVCHLTLWWCENHEDLQRAGWAKKLESTFPTFVKMQRKRGELRYWVETMSEEYHKFLIGSLGYTKGTQGLKGLLVHVGLLYCSATATADNWSDLNDFISAKSSLQFDKKMIENDFITIKIKSKMGFVKGLTILSENELRELRNKTSCSHIPVADFFCVCF